MGFIEINSTNFGSIQQLLQFPSLNMPAFYPLVFLALFVIITLTSYFSEKERKGEGNLLSSLAVSGIVLIILSVASQLIGLISTYTMIMILIICMIFDIIYLLNKD